MARKTSSAAGTTRTKSATTGPAAKPAAKKPRASNSVAAETAAKSDTPKASKTKKSTASKSAVATKSAAPKKSPAPKSAIAAKPSAAKSSVSESTASKASGAAARPVGRPKKAAPVIKLNDRQREFLTRIKGEEDKGGYFMEKKIEERTLEALRERKLVKRGAKDKEKGAHPWTLTKLGEKTLGGSSEAAPQGA